MSKKKIRLIIADDHPIVIEGLQSFLDEIISYEVEVIGTASNGEGVMDILRTRKDDVDIVLLDVEMPRMDGLMVAKKIQANYSHIKVLIISTYDSHAFVSEALLAEAAGYLIKGSSKEEILRAIVSIYEGSNYYSPQIIKVLKEIALNKNKPQLKLTKRELEILKFTGQGLTASKIAEKLFIAEVTVNTHRNNLKDKLELKNIKELVRYAVENGYV